MIAKMTCSNCGAEMSNLNFSAGRRYWLFMIPVMLLGFYPLLRMSYFKGDATKDLVISEVEKRSNGPITDVVGVITNKGSRKWSSVTIEAEFFDGSGVFLDEQSSLLRAEIPAGAKEHFKISLRASDPKLKAEDTKMVVKVAGGHTMPF
jgi:hypothetical protein